MTNNYKYIIIGGGIAGLTCANNLSNTNYLLLESTNRLGGRIFSKKIDNNIIEFGAKWIHGEVPNFPTNKIEYVIEKNIDGMQDFTIVDSMFPKKKIIEILEKYRKADYKHKKKFCDSINLEKNEKILIDNIFAEDFGEHICNISMSNKDFKIYPGKNKRITNGYTKILNIPQNYKLNSRVINIKKNKENLFEVYTKNNKYICENIILAVPLTIIKNKFLHLLSNKKQNIISKLEMGKINILILFFDKIFWNENTTYWFSRRFPNIVVVNGLNNVLYMKEFSSQNMNSKNYKQYLSYFFPNYSDPIKVINHNWNKNIDFQGSWTYHKENVTKDELKYLSKTEDKIGLIGEYTSHNRWGTTDGAYFSAINYCKKYT